MKSKFSEEKLTEIQTQINKKSSLYDYMSKDYPFEAINSKFGDEDDLEATLYVPSYQKEFIWDIKRQSRFIESVLLGVPLTPFLVSEDDENRLEIIDGSQRIRTLIAFYENKLRLRNLDKLELINSSKFDDLPRRAKNYFKNRDFKIIITDESEMKIKQDIFHRINTSSQRLTDSEIRKSSYAGNFYDMILKLKKDKNFRDICPISKEKEKRGEYEELILRFFAYTDQYKLFKHDVATFLNDYLDEMNESDFSKKSYLMKFNNMVNFISTYFPIGFRKTKNNKSIPRVRFEAISVGVYLALNENMDSQKPNMEWLDSKGFKIQTTSDMGNNPGRLAGRIEFVRDGLLGQLSSDRLEHG